ncbi:MAG: PIN domain nuclease [Nitrospira sp.]|nr:MAG: PIN domain nuclease [Nitrospira sp.]
MIVLVDTSVWSIALRRSSAQLNERQQQLVMEWRTLIEQRRVAMIGPIRQEILSGIRSVRVFENLRARLMPFPDLPLDAALYEEAAACFNRCRAEGVMGTAIDMMVCAAAARFGLSIFTTDRDFERYAEVLSVRLHARMLSFPSI